MGYNNKKKNKNRNKKKERQNALRFNQKEESSEDKTEQLGEEQSESMSYDTNEDEMGNSQKRQHSNDSDSEEEQVKKKKKKKQPVPSDTPKKGGKSIRQMKREKFVERQAEAQAVAKDQLKSQCLNYLSQWKHDKQNWKFMKAKQVWLYKNKFSTKLLPDSSWPLLLEYFESAQGNIRKMLLDDAKKIIKQMDEWTESQAETEENKEDQDEDDNSTDTSKIKPNDDVYKRARDLIQCLEE